MAHARGAVLVVAVTLVLVALAASVRAQGTCASDLGPLDNAFCSEYLWANSWIHPPLECCNALRRNFNAYGKDCYCKKLNMYNPISTDNMTKAYTLPQDCEVAADMTNCPTPVPPPGAAPAAPPPPPGRSPPTPPGALRAPPGAPSMSDPTTATASPPARSASSSSSLALPVGGGIIGGGVGLSVIIWLIVTRCKCHWQMKWDLNNKCCCCQPRPPKRYSQRLDQTSG